MARFVYWFPDNRDYGDPFPVYRTDQNNDVGADAILKSGKPIPTTPTFETWKALTHDKLRCPRCWMTTRGATDLSRHMEIAHSLRKGGIFK